MILFVQQTRAKGQTIVTIVIIVIIVIIVTIVVIVVVVIIGTIVIIVIIVMVMTNGHHLSGDTSWRDNQNSNYYKETRLSCTIERKDYWSLPLEAERTQLSQRSAIITIERTNCGFCRVKPKHTQLSQRSTDHN